MIESLRDSAEKGPIYTHKSPTDILKNPLNTYSGATDYIWGDTHYIPIYTHNSPMYTQKSITNKQKKPVNLSSPDDPNLSGVAASTHPNHQYKHSKHVHIFARETYQQTKETDHFRFRRTNFV